MDKKILVDKDIDTGEALIESLDRAGFPVHTAVWRYDGERGYWKLVLASPVVDEKGTLKGLRLIHPHVRRFPWDQLNLEHVWVIGVKDRLVTALRSKRMGPPKPGARLGLVLHNNDVLADEVYVYRVRPPRPRARRTAARSLTRPAKGRARRGRALSAP